jgi:hypothetical protein
MASEHALYTSRGRLYRPGFVQSQRASLTDEDDFVLLTEDDKELTVEHQLTA